MSTISSSLEAAVRTLSGRSESPRLDAEVLLSEVLGVRRTALLTGGERPVSEERRRVYEELIHRRARGMPIPYLTGTREFWSLPLAVTPDVLVPRPETELLVELALAHCSADSGCAILDLGTGSGAIAVAIASERPRARITAVDVSPAALAVARANAERLGLPNIDWRQGSWFQAVAGERFDLIVSNPPYIAADDPALAALAAEPLLALSPGPTGLEALSVIIAGAHQHLETGGRLLLEHGRDQSSAVRGLFASGGFEPVRTHVDYSGNPRVTEGGGTRDPIRSHVATTVT